MLNIIAYSNRIVSFDASLKFYSKHINYKLKVITIGFPTKRRAYHSLKTTYYLFYNSTTQVL